MNKKANKLLLYSGGLDSTAILYGHKSKIKMCVFFDYGSKHNKTEYKYALKHCKNLDKKLIKIKIAMPFETALTSNKISEKGENNKSTVVPFRNGIFLSYAVGLCEQYGLKSILIGTNNPPETIYKDTTASFIYWYEYMINAGYEKKINIENPLQGLSKKETAELLYKYGKIKPHDTYSCYKGDKNPCGVCSACIKRNSL